ncbi:MAG: energy-coupling factor ABC transporter ATP-binding protein [Gammaproteobacteria bacterium]|nr:energy-coupling factor ABC transporter ATP-binding protein [Gammaproteobacteria bacterium]
MRDLCGAITFQRLGVIGLNGSGKSSLLRLIAGLETPTEGGITLDHKPSTDCAVGYVFQNPDHQLLMPTVREDIRFGLVQSGLDKTLADAQAMQLLEQHQLSSIADAPVAELSEGQKQLVCLLAILIMTPELIVFDEPFSALDWVQQQRMQQRIVALAVPSIHIGHQPSELRYCDQVLWLDEGTLKAHGPADDVLSQYETFCRAQLDRD